MSDKEYDYSELNASQLLVGWFHSYLHDKEDYYWNFENELNRRGL